MKYEILEHKADLKIRAFGRTREELFQNMLSAMSESMKPIKRKAQSAGREADSLKGCKRKIKITSLDLNALLVDFLSEALYLSQTKKETYNTVNFRKFTETEIEGDLIGESVIRFGEDIKAATYHNLEVNQKEDGSWETIVLFDI